MKDSVSITRTVVGVAAGYRAIKVVILIVIYNDENEIIFQSETKGYFVQPDLGPERPMAGVIDDAGAQTCIDELEQEAQKDERRNRSKLGGGGGG